MITEGHWIAIHRPDRKSGLYNYEVRSDESCNDKPMLVGQVCLFPDAILFSAAPELLEACRLILLGLDRMREEAPKQWQSFRAQSEHGFEDFGQGLSDARDAIAKATGEAPDA